MDIKDIDVKKRHNENYTGKQDPDKLSESLREYHACLFENRKIKSCSFTIKTNKPNHIIFNNGKIEIIFTPDSITNIFQLSNRKWKSKSEKEILKDYCNQDKKIKELTDEFNTIDYTIGSSIVFPIRINGESIGNTLNRARGVLYKIHDRIDYTLECIKRYFEGNTEDNPLKNSLSKNKEFFDLFYGFEEYVDFFMLNDLIDENGNVKSLCNEIDFNKPFPETLEDYQTYIRKTNEFIKARNKRIKEWCESYKE